MGVNGITEYQNTAGVYEASRTAAAQRGKTPEAAKPAAKGLPGLAGKKGFAPVIATESKEYGKVVGEPQLSEKAAKYYDSLKAKFGNMDFILVSKDMKQAAKAQAAGFGNPNRTVVLIDEEKLERMATDESFRKKYEGIIAGAQSKLQEMSKTMGANSGVTGFGMQVDKDGKTSFFATVKDSGKGQKERIEKKRTENREAKKAAEKKAAEKRAEKRAEKKAEEAERYEDRIRGDEEETEGIMPEKRYDPTDRVITADTAEDLVRKVSDLTYAYTPQSVPAEGSPLGGHIDFKG